MKIMNIYQLLTAPSPSNSWMNQLVTTAATYVDDGSLEVPAEARKQPPLFSSGGASNRGEHERTRGGGFLSRAKPFDGAILAPVGCASGDSGV